MTRGILKILYNGHMRKPKVALVHDFLNQRGGGEATLEAIAEIFPDAPIYTFIYNPKKYNGGLKGRKIITPGKQSNFVFNLIPILAKFFTFLIPATSEEFNFDGFDIIISNTCSYAKGILTKPNQLHISYIHTPPRFLYKYSVESTKRDAWYFKPVVMLIDHHLRLWDYLAAQRPDYIITNSKNTQARIKKFYRRESTVINPPVEINYPPTAPRNNLERPYYLAIGRFSAYKNFDLLIKIFNLLDLPLKIIGSGNEERKLKKMAGENIEFLGRIADPEKHQVIEHCIGLINPVIDEDFGIVPIEAMAHGKPVLAHKSGGALEMVEDGKTGIFFTEATVESLVQKVKDFDKMIRAGSFNEKYIKNSAQKFSRERFKRELQAFVQEKWEGFNKNS